GIPPHIREELLDRTAHRHEVAADTCWIALLHLADDRRHHHRSEHADQRDRDDDFRKREAAATTREPASREAHDNLERLAVIVRSPEDEPRVRWVTSFMCTAR